MAKLEVLKPKAQLPDTAPADPRPEPRASVPAIPQSPVPATGRIQVSTQEIDVFRLGDTLARSGYFTEARDAAKAVVKILTGMELGFGPIASMTGVFISPGGKPCLHANMMSARIKSAPGFDYEIRKLDNTVCEIAVLRNGKVVEPVISFSLEDAQTAGLTSGKNAHTWKKYPRNMLFSRAISNAAKWHCPELFSGVTAYTPEELDMRVNGEGEVIEVGEAPPKPKQGPAPLSANGRQMTKDQKELILKLTKSDVFSDAERDKAALFVNNPESTGEQAAKFITSLEKHIAQRKDTDGKTEASGAGSALEEDPESLTRDISNLSEKEIQSLRLEGRIFCEKCKTLFTGKGVGDFPGGGPEAQASRLGWTKYEENGHRYDLCPKCSQSGQTAKARDEEMHTDEEALKTLQNKIVSKDQERTLSRIFNYYEFTPEMQREFVTFALEKSGMEDGPEFRQMLIENFCEFLENYKCK